MKKWYMKTIKRGTKEDPFPLHARAQIAVFANKHGLKPGEIIPLDPCHTMSNHEYGYDVMYYSDRELE